MSCKIGVKRVYEPPAAADGMRVLVDRLWPRGLRKDAASIDLWLKEVAPSAALRKWYGHEPERWPEFRKRYEAELDERQADVETLLRLAREGPLTLLYAARDGERSNAEVLWERLEQRLARRS
ncbi:DUF488 domain-containing protein [Methylocella sp.]|uniref:DUF488 domain-containing protein n=1 Tax=Methylocella sp. TaxID=1978226 RepID=UPI003784E750